jgi:hypothetical protein
LLLKTPPPPLPEPLPFRLFTSIVLFSIVAKPCD